MKLIINLLLVLLLCGTAQAHGSKIPSYMRHAQPNDWCVEKVDTLPCTHYGPGMLCLVNNCFNGIDTSWVLCRDSAMWLTPNEVKKLKRLLAIIDFGISDCGAMRFISPVEIIVDSLDSCGWALMVRNESFQPRSLFGEGTPIGKSENK